MSMMFKSVSHLPRAIAFDFCMFTVAPVAASYRSSKSFNLGTSSTTVRNIVTSSVYAVATVFECCLPILMPLRFFSKDYIRGFRHSTYSIMLRGHPWRMELLIGIVSDRNPLICITDVAFSYSCVIFCRKLALIP